MTIAPHHTHRAFTRDEAHAAARDAVDALAEAGNLTAEYLADDLASLAADEALGMDDAGAGLTTEEWQTLCLNQAVGITATADAALTYLADQGRTVPHLAEYDYGNGSVREYVRERAMRCARCDEKLGVVTGPSDWVQWTDVDGWDVVGVWGFQHGCGEENPPHAFTWHDTYGGDPVRAFAKRLRPFSRRA